jgi:hypothetical protein
MDLITTPLNIEDMNNNIINQNNIINDMIIQDDINNNIIDSNILINTELSVNNESTNDRYLNILDALGLNTSISYPLKMIIQTIIELHVETQNGKTNYSRYARIFKFKTDVYSTKIKENFGETYGQFISYQQISRNITRMYRNYTYNNTINLLKNNVNKNQPDNKNQIIGFNYENPCWNSYEISVI